MNKLVSTLGITLLLVVLPGIVRAVDSKPAGKTGSAEFERMKSLVGTWSGKVDMGQGPIEMTSTYTVIAGGSVIQERSFAGTPNEMTTMYFDNGGKISGTHYCVIGNRPQFLLKASDAKSITFDFDSSCGIDPLKEPHMHSLKLVFQDANTLVSSCDSLIGGKAQPNHEVVFKRVK